MKWISEESILIVGLGLIGGSYARALKRLGFHVAAIDINQESIDYALENGIIDEGYTTVEPAVVSNADAVVFTSRLSVDSRSAADEWTYMPSVKLPAWSHIVTGVPASRATQPVTEWDCPYIYVFGGVTPTGGLSNNIWRGVINRLSFKPLY